MPVASELKARPTRVRYVVIALTTMVAVLLYVDRICLSFAERYVREDLGITETQMGIVLSSFYWTYSLGQVPAGWLSDRFGPRLMFAVYLGMWSLLTGMLGLVQGIVGLIALRLGCGLFEAGAYPTAAGIVRHWMPFRRRGLASGIVSIGGRFGGAVAPLLTAVLMVAFVPIGVSSLFTEADLLDVSQLLPPSPTAPSTTHRSPTQMKLAQLIIMRLPDDERNAIMRGEIPDTPDFLPTLEHILNGCLADPNLLNDVDLSALNLPSEARHLLEASAHGLSQSEIERRNRLVLESAFPEALRKIYGSSWRPVMAVYGILGILVACLFWWCFRNSPRQHPRCNEAEIQLIQGDEPAQDPGKRPPRLPLVRLVTHRGLWASSLVQFLTNIGWAFLVTWLPDFLRKTYNVPPITLGLMTSLPIFIGMAGMFWGGWLTDFVTSRIGVRWGRAAPLAATRLLAAAAFAACFFLNSPWPITIAMAGVALATDLGTPAIWAFSMDIGGKHVGSVLGFSNMWGNLGAAVTSILLAWLLANSWTTALFVICTGAFVLAAVLALFLDSTRPIMPAPNLAA